MWITMRTEDWTTPGKKYPEIMAWATIMQDQRKGVLKTTLSTLSSEWSWDKTKVKRFLNKLSTQGLITYSSSKDGIVVTIVNFDDYPEPSHQKPVSKKKDIKIATIKDRLPSSGLDANQNFACWMWRNIKAHVGENKTLDGALLNDWAGEIRKMIELDGRDTKEMSASVKWALKDEFWAQTLRSAAGFRKHYDKIMDKYRAQLPQEETAGKRKW